MAARDKGRLGIDLGSALFCTALLLLLALPGRAAVPMALAPAEYPVFSDDLDFRQLDTALDRSLSHLERLGPGASLTLAGQPIPAGRLIDSLRHLQRLIRTRPSPDTLNAELRRSYALLRLNLQPHAPSPRMLITGYYQPVFAGSPRRRPPYVHPLYRVPDNLVVSGKGGARVGRMVQGRLQPYWTRREIERQQLLRGQELAWLKDPFDAFVLHIQGSGMIRYDDGSLHGVHYARSNGREYRSIGKFLVDTGRMQLAEVTMDTIRAYIDAHPEERELILHHNDSFIFFHGCPPGPVTGSLGEELTAGRSIAADPQWYPPGALVFVDSRRPVFSADGRLVEWQPLQRFVSVQDSGSALTGPGRIDLFWGSGEQAGREAGTMKEDGRVYLLLLKEAAAAP